jgi:hypothetical protein
MARQGSGDRLAAGGIKATFGPVEPVSQEKWDDIFADFDPKVYCGRAYLSPAGDVGVKLREVTKSRSRQ